jgi:hypothetical protein
LRIVWNQGSRFEELIPHDQCPISPNPDHETPRALDTLDGASKRSFGEGEGLGHITSITVMVSSWMVSFFNLMSMAKALFEGSGHKNVLCFPAS